MEAFPTLSLTAIAMADPATVPPRGRYAQPSSCFSRANHAEAIEREGQAIKIEE